MESPFASLIISVVLKAAIIIIALQIALNKTKSLSGAAGTWATKAGTAVFGTALAGTALVGRHTIGRGARALADSDAGKRFIAKTGVVGEVTDRALRATSSGTMDIRGIPGMDKAGLGRPANKGGYDKHLGDQTKRKVELGKRLEKDKFGNTLTATDWRGRPVKEQMTEWEERDVMRPSASGATDSAGNPLMERVKERVPITKEKDVSAKEMYVKGLEKERVRYFAKKEGYKQARADRDAATTLKKEKTKKEKLAEAAAEYEKEQKELSGETTEKEAAETTPKESEKPKEV